MKIILMDLMKRKRICTNHGINSLVVERNERLKSDWEVDGEMIGDENVAADF